MAPAAASIVSGEKPNSNKKGWREDAVKDETSTTKGLNAAGRQHKAKPDQEAQKKAVRQIETEMDELKVKLNAVKEQISRSDPKNAASNDGQQELRKRLAEIRKIQADAKQSRVKIYDKLDSMKSSLSRKMNDLKSAKEKTPFKNSKDVNEKIAKLEKEIESGKLKLIEEKRVVTEINNLKKSLKSVETFHAQQEAIDAEKKEIDEIRKQLEDPESKSLGEEFKRIQDKLNAATKSKDAEFAQRKVIYDNRNALQKEMDDLRERKRSLQDDFRTAMNEWYNAAQEERERKQAEYKRQQQEAITVKRAAAAAAERDAADVPAFSDEIAGCNALLTYLQQSSEKTNIENSASTAPAPPEVAAALAGTKQPEAFLMKKKKTDEDFFVGGKYARKQSGKKATSKDSNAKAFKLPLAVMERFWQIKVDVPLSSADIPKTIEALKEKRDWYEKESPRVTAENKAKAEAKIAALANAKTEDSVEGDEKAEASKVEDKA